MSDQYHKEVWQVWEVDLAVDLAVAPRAAFPRRATAVTIAEARAAMAGSSSVVLNSRLE
jgi:hypothetical protein